MVELDAKRFGSSAVAYEQSMSLGALLKRYGFHFTSLIAVIVFMIAGFSPMLAVFYCVLMCFLLSAITPETSLGPRRLLLPLLAISAVILTPALIDVLTPLVNALLRVQIPLVAFPGMTDLVGYYLPALILVLLAGLAILGLMNVGNEEVLHTKKLTRTLSDGSIGVLSAATTCASAGIIVGVVTLTGLGLKFSSIVLDYAGGSLLLTAIYTALVVWIVGLAVPVTASYIICAVIAAPALTKLGVPDYAAHMFIFYYAVLSEVSPPTALSPFAAAAITGGDPYITTMQAWKYTLPAFLVPFVFVLDPNGVGLLMKIPKDGSVWDILLITAKTAAGLGALAAAAQNWALRQNTTAERVLWVLAGLLLVFPSLLEALAERISGYDVPHPAPLGLAICIALLLKQFMSLARPPAAAKG
jgi:TRAP-type uncharacterized transport system fused permease subunit